MWGSVGALAVADGAAVGALELEDGAGLALGVAEEPAGAAEIGGQAHGLGAGLCDVARVPPAAQAATTPRLHSASRHLDPWWAMVIVRSLAR
jgi:hypothetical protein